MNFTQKKKKNSFFATFLNWFHQFSNFFLFFSNRNHRSRRWRIEPWSPFHWDKNPQNSLQGSRGHRPLHGNRHHRHVRQAVPDQQGHPPHRRLLLVPEILRNHWPARLLELVLPALHLRPGKHLQQQLRLSQRLRCSASGLSAGHQ